MSILSSLGRLAAEISEQRVRNQTERAISALPIELQKDIGWPDAADTKIVPGNGIGSWRTRSESENHGSGLPHGAYGQTRRPTTTAKGL